MFNLQRYHVPDNWQFVRARKLFEEPLVTPGKDLDFKWSEPDEEGLVKFLCGENGFNEERIRLVHYECMLSNNFILMHSFNFRSSHSSR